MTDRTASPVRLAAAGAGVALLALTVWAFWQPLGEMAGRWLSDPQYSHGYLVPVFSAYLLWARRGRLAGADLLPSWWGLAPIAAAAVLRYLATLNYEYFDGIALVLTLTGFVLLTGGVQALDWAWPGLAFLLFMLPLPYSVEHAVAAPLQRVATACSTYIMQTIGLPALSEGNVIVLGSGRIEIERACSGLSMLLIFFALATAMAILVRRPLLDRLVILASAAPIAIIANVARITATGLAQEWFGPEAARKIFHDWAGWMMMPFALALVWLELGFLSLLLRETEAAEEAPLGFDHPVGAAAGGPKTGRSAASASRGVPPPIGPGAVRMAGS
jgi:exosortase